MLRNTMGNHSAFQCSSFFPPPLFPPHYEGTCLYVLTCFFSWFYLWDTIAQCYCQLREVQGDKKKNLGHVYSSLFHATSGKKMPKQSIVQLSRLFNLQISCPKSCSIFTRFIKLRSVPHGIYNFFLSLISFVLGGFGLFVQLVCINVLLLLISL